MDESGLHTSMSCLLRAKAPRGERAYGKVPRKRGRNQTLVASITLDGAMGESVSIEEATTPSCSRPTSSGSWRLRSKWGSRRWVQTNPGLIPGPGKRRRFDGDRQDLLPRSVDSRFRGNDGHGRALLSLRARGLNAVPF